MQVGDPFMGKLLLEACLELFAADVLEGIQDMGAAGLTSSSVEMAGRAKNGIELDLDLVPRRAKNMTPYEILLSESQERMLLVAKPGCEQQVLAICNKWELSASVIGVVTNSGRWVVKATPGYDPLSDKPVPRAPVVVCDLPTPLLTDDAPVYDRPRSRAPAPAAADLSLVISTDAQADLSKLLGSPNVGSRQWIVRQYDHIVRGGTMVRPGSDAAVVRVPCEKDGTIVWKHLAFAVDCNARFVQLAPEEGAKMAIAEVCRNLAVSGAEPIGITDCLNFANPERPEIMDQLARAIDGLAAACNALQVPIVGGNVSLYNETTVPEGKRPILPTPTVAAVGLIKDPSHIVTQWFKAEGDLVFLAGQFAVSAGEGLGGSELWVQRTGSVGGPAPRIDLDAEVRLQRFLLAAARATMLQSAHDVADGGLLVALAECTSTAPAGTQDLGARLDLPVPSNPQERTAFLFGEAPTRVVLSVSPAKREALEALAAAHQIPLSPAGTVQGTTLEVPAASVLLQVQQIRTLRESCLAFAG
jgi:phosphoribosylformylglycinamidine synthase